MDLSDRVRADRPQAGSTYLDHAANTPMRESARQAWLEAADQVGNPSSVHAAGRAARRLVEEARERIGDALGVDPGSVLFTSGATEADNLAVLGTARAWGGGAVVTSTIEHKAVLGAVAATGSRRIDLPVDAGGVVDPDELRRILTREDNVAQVAVMWVNNEIGSVQPVAALAAICSERGVPFHVDAVQAVGVLPVDLSLATTAAVSAHKVGGPMGVGVLTFDPLAAPAPLLFGGSQESGLRPGTLDVPGIVAASVAFEDAVAEQQQHARRLGALSGALLAGLAALDPAYVLNSDPSRHHPGIVNVTFPGCEGDALLVLLDAAGISLSTGSACAAGIPQPSHVLMAMGADRIGAASAVRVSFGRTSRDGDVTTLLAALPAAVAGAQRAGQVRAVAAGAR